MKFDMGRAWNDGISRVSANFSLLAILGGVFFFIPSVILYLAMPEMMDMMMMPGGDPEAMSKAMENVLPRFAVLYLLVMVSSFVGYAAMMALIGDSRRLSVGEAIAVGFRSLLPLVAMLLLFAVGYVLFAILVGIVFGLIVAGLGMVSQALAFGVAALLGIAVFVAVLLLLTRLSLSLPLVALQRITNPLLAFRQSWQLTRPVQWPLTGFYVLFFVAYMVFAIVIFMVMGLVAAALDAPAALGFLNGVVGALVAMVLSGLMVGIYRQVAGSAPTAVGETFS